MGVWYASRGQLRRASGMRESARNNAQLDRALESGSRAAEAQLHRRFYPQQDTRTFDWPAGYSRPWRLWLEQHELVSAAKLTAGGVEIAEGDYLLRPDSGPPFTHVEIDLSSSAVLQAGATHQRAISIAGVYAGAAIDEAPAGALAAGVDASSTTVDLTRAGDVGQVLRAGDERMVVTAVRMLDTGQDLGGDLAARADDVAVAVADGDSFEVDETILVDSERMLIVDIAGDTLTVIRAWDGTVLATHTAGADVYAPRRLTVTRGALGTTAAGHDASTGAQLWVPPGLVTDLSIAEALVRLGQETAGYARTVGSGDNQRESSGRGLAQIRHDAWVAHGRKLRKRAV